MCNINYPKFLCRICASNVHDKDNAVQCDLCELSIRIKCNSLIYFDYRYLQNCNESWYFMELCSTLFPFNSLLSNKKFLACCISSDSNIVQSKDLGNDHDSLLLLKPSPNLLVSQFKMLPQKIVMALKIFFLLSIMTLTKRLTLFLSLSLFRINACFLNKNFDNLQHLLSCIKKHFDIIAISERRITKQVSLLNNLNLNNYSFEFTLTETSAGGTLLYIANHLSYKCRIIDPDIISGNLTATISDHLPQFTIPNMFSKISGIKSNIYERDWLKFDRANFILDEMLTIQPKCI